MTLPKRSGGNRNIGSTNLDTEAAARDRALAPARVQIKGDADVSHARKLATEMARDVGLSRSSAFGLVTVVSELGTNIVLHALSSGWLSLTKLSRAGRQGVELTVEDDGPGIADIQLAMTDGFSTGQGLGCGLPGSRRLMDEFDIKSTLGVGTRIVARLWQ